jgi:hypothetical protein
VIFWGIVCFAFLVFAVHRWFSSIPFSVFSRLRSAELADSEESADAPTPRSAKSEGCKPGAGPWIAPKPPSDDPPEGGEIPARLVD